MIQKNLKVKRLALPALLAMALGAEALAGSIDIGLPVMSGDVSTFEHRQRTGPIDLSPKQLQALSQWLEQHRSGWQGMVTPATSEPIQLEVTLKHSDGGTTSICVIDAAGGGHYLRVTGPGEWAYRSIGGIYRSRAATRPLSDKELAALLSIASTA